MNQFIKDKDYVYINHPYAEAYISESLFADAEKESAIAKEYGNGIKTIGMFYMCFFDNDEDVTNEVREKTESFTFNYPNTIITYPTDYDVEILTINGVSDKYRILKYYKGDIMMNAFVPHDSENAELFLRLLSSGKIPKIDYDDIFIAWVKNFKSNDLTPAAPGFVLQAIIAEMARCAEDPSIPFRKLAGTKNTDINDYVMLSMNAVSAYSSVLAGLTFERFSDKLTTSLLMTLSGQKQTKSPIEKVLSM